MTAPVASATPALDVQPEHLAVVRNILQKHVPGYAVWAFGSRAKRTSKPFSDLDLVVITEQPLSLALFAALGEEFSQSNLPWRVDVVDWATASDVFRTIIEGNKVMIQPAKTQQKAPEPDRAPNRENP
nr:nucleotidyltransferase domain-containing protein [Rhodoferax sp.]